MYDMHDLIRKLIRKNESKIVLLVADGLGGLPLEPGGLTELESARTPHFDALAKAGTLGLSIPVLPGITPGSGSATSELTLVVIRSISKAMYAHPTVAPSCFC